MASPLRGAFPSQNWALETLNSLSKCKLAHRKLSGFPGRLTWNMQFLPLWVKPGITN
jgi:hypothetical protein